MPENGPYRAERAEHTHISPEQAEIDQLKTEVEGLKLQLESLRRKEKWEYDVFKDSSLDADIYIKMLNRAGDAGWELVSSERTDNYRMFFLKRPK